MSEITNNQAIWLAEIESSVILEYMPFFFALDHFIEEETFTVQLMVCCKSFKSIPVNQRIHKIYNLINETNPDILKNINIVIQTYDVEEFEGMIDCEFI